MIEWTTLFALHIESLPSGQLRQMTPCQADSVVIRKRKRQSDVSCTPGKSEENDLCKGVDAITLGDTGPVQDVSSTKHAPVFILRYYGMLGKIGNGLTEIDLKEQQPPVETHDTGTHAAANLDSSSPC